MKLRKMRHGNLCPNQRKKTVIGTKWVFRNKLYEYGKVVRNKAIFFYKGYAQVEGIDFEENFSPVASL
jgi:hypothetical protein